MKNTTKPASEEEYLRSLYRPEKDYSDAVPPSDLCFKKAALFLKQVDPLLGLDCSITCDGSICIERKGQNSLEVWDFYPDGGVALMLKVGGNVYFSDETQNFIP